MKKYTLRMPKAVEQQLQKCRASIRQTINERLRVIVEAVATHPPALRKSPGRKPPTSQGPPLRFYVLEGYRVSYVVNAVTRSVDVLELQPSSG